MNTKEKPKSWAVLNDGDPLFHLAVLKYLKEQGCSFDGTAYDAYYGLSKHGGFIFTDKSDMFSTILTLDEFCEIFLGEKKEPNIDAVEEKQTAVDYLVEKLENTIGNSIISVMQEEVKKAKEMEKEQIKDAVVELQEFEMLELIEKMCTQSLCPETFEMWEKVKEELITIRNIQTK